jgi:DHA2 family multidrug resistance protein-like MFS transporter
MPAIQGVDGVTGAVAKAGRREWLGLAVLALPCLLYSMDLTVLYLALPQLSADLKPTSTQLLWITDIYGFLLAGLLITMGTLGDRIGRRRLLLIGALGFGAASLLAAFAASAEMLIIARALLGVAAATLAPSTLALIRNMFLDEQQRTVAVGIWIASFSVGAAIGPLVGGALLQFFWWGSVFLAGLPIMALLLVLGPLLLPEFRDPAPGRLDLASAALSLFSILGLVYGLKQTAAVGFGTRPLFALLFGIFLAVVFVRRQQGLDDPLVDVGLFRSAAFTTTVAAMCVAVFLVAGTDFFLGQYLQLVFDKSPLVAGLWLLPGVAGLVTGSLLAPPLVARARAAHLLTAALALTAAGAVALTQLQVGHGLAALVAGTTTIGLGAGVVGTLATDFVVSAAPAERRRSLGDHRDRCRARRRARRRHPRQYRGRRLPQRGRQRSACGAHGCAARESPRQPGRSRRPNRATTDPPRRRRSRHRAHRFHPRSAGRRAQRRTNRGNARRARGRLPAPPTWPQWRVDAHRSDTTTPRVGPFSGLENCGSYTATTHEAAVHGR